MHGLSKEKIKLKERLFDLEQALGLKQQKLLMEKSEINREKEFIARLKEQSLCVECLRGINNKGENNNYNNLQPSPFQHNPIRSSGDGLELSDFNNPVKISQILTPKEQAYFLHENKYLQELVKRK